MNNLFGDDDDEDEFM